VADGRYEVVLRTFDPTGSMTSEDAQPLEVRSIQTGLSLSVEPSAFSPNGDQVRDETFLRWKADSAFAVSSWDWTVSPREGGRAVYTARGKGPLPARLYWDGRGTAGTVAPDGVYRVKLSIRDKNGNVMGDESNPVTVDTAAPVASMDLKPAFVVPAKTPVQARLRVEDAVGVVSWKVTVRDEWGRPFKTDSGTPPFPKTWVWDGTSDRGGTTVAAPGSFFSVILEAVDAAGNRGLTSQVALQVEPGAAAGGSQQMSLNLATVFFDDRSASLGEEALKELRGAVESIRPYLAKSTLKVLGYADVGETGDPIHASHARAAAVRDFLARELRIEPTSISAVGYGTRDPLSTPAGPAPPEKQRRAVVTLVTTP
jgi:outer membrane protein OmpA-like peptidoglycan-associated protein